MHNKDKKRWEENVWYIKKEKSKEEMMMKKKK